AVLQAEDEVLAALEVPRRGRHDRLVDTDAGLLEGTGEDPLRNAVLVGVDADAPLVEYRGLLEGTVAARPGDLEDHLGTLPDLVLRDRRALRDVGEVVRVLHEGLRPLDGLRSAVLVAGDVRVDRRNLLPTGDTDDLLAHALGHLRREHAHQAATLLRRVGDPFL